ncbi:hypothetical protein SEA_BUMBLE_56 [Arthrobacter phage Bumble]|uniref:Uncharacterized protein n=1 Tax=Arthrobacter phage Bumble TaxID=2743904 RepID=A0A7G3V9T2_9CAUD|nr:hypothetical protein SEA_BUMBLE_56 [Arthrobacter phage Bumble]
MTAPRYVSADVSGKGYLLRLDDLGSYEAIASGSINTMRDLARELTQRDAGIRDDRILPNHPDGTPKTGDELLAEQEPREVQLDALVIPGDTDRHPELHADRRPDSYGFMDNRARDGRGRAIGFAVSRDPRAEAALGGRG